MNRKANVFSSIALAGLTLALCLGLSGCRKPQETGDTAEHAASDVIRLTPEAARSIGLTTSIVELRQIRQEITTTGEIKADENRVFHINSFVSGRIARDYVTLGDPIRQGQTLAEIQNLEVAKIQADYIHQLHQNEIDVAQAKTRLALAQKNLEREKNLLAEGISPRKEYQQAVAEEALAHQALQGLQEHAIHLKSEAAALLKAYGMRPGSSGSEKIHTESPIKAPRSGVITQKNVTLGDMVTPETIMYEVADLSRIWLDIAVHPKDFSAIRQRQRIAFRTDSLPGKVFTGTIDYLQPAASPSSHTYTARAFLKNPQGLLKPGMFGQVTISQSGTLNLPFLPESAVQRYGRESFVFIPVGNLQFRKQTITLGGKLAEGYLVEKGLQAGDTVVVQGSFALKSALFKNQFAEED
jgi:cobalt-zinc-cadmium efflux system membrane fusion protein